MQIITESKPKQQQKSNTNQLLTTGTLLNRGMTVDECKIMCTHHSIDLREKLFFRIIYETQLRPFEVLNLLVEQWDRKQGFVTALKVKQKTKPRKGDHRAKDRLPSIPKTRAITPSTNEMLREYVSNRKKGPVFVNENGDMLSLEWFNQEISRYAKLLGIQKIIKYYVDGRTLKLVTCMALREAGERHHDNAGGSRKLSAVAADHTMHVKEKHYEKVGEDIEQITQSYQKHHPAWVEGW
jgi:integrase